MTHDKTRWAVVIGRKVIYMARPTPTKQKKYREPFMVDKRTYKTKSQALMAAASYDV